MSAQDADAELIEQLCALNAEASWPDAYAAPAQERRRERARATLALVRGAAAHPVPVNGFLEGVNVERLHSAMIWLGVSSGDGGMESAALRLAEHVNALTRAIMKHKAMFDGKSSQQTAR